MNRIMIVGSPGSGKSTLSKKLHQILGYPILHLDKIYHIDNNHQISREELKRLTKDFVDLHDSFIIDGNYGKTMKFRMQFVDTVIILDIDTSICLENIEKRRLSSEKRTDIASGFDNSIQDQTFIQYVKDFKKDKFPQIIELKNQFNHLNYFYLSSYKEIDAFVDSV